VELQPPSEPRLQRFPVLRYRPLELALMGLLSSGAGVGFAVPLYSTSVFGALASALAGIGFGVFLVLLVGSGVNIELWGAQNEVRVVRGRKTETYPYSTLRCAEREDIDESSFFYLVLIRDDAQRLPVAMGRRAMVDAARQAINLALGSRYENYALMPDELRTALREADEGLATSTQARPFGGFDKLGEAARWDCMERFLLSIPWPEARVVRKQRENRIELRGKKRELPLRVEFDPYTPSGTSVECTVTGQLGYMDLSYDPAAGDDVETPQDADWDKPAERPVRVGPQVFADDREALKGFIRLPADLQQSVIATMRKERIDIFRVRPNGASARCHGTLFDHRDPAAHVTAVVELLADVSAFAAQARAQTSI
jgi:hypothetical protein